MLLSKEEFVEYMEFIQNKQLQQEKLANTLEDLCPGCRCDTFIYCEYEDKLVKLISRIMHDDEELISWKLYEFDSFGADLKAQVLATEAPEAESWETVYDYLTREIE